MSKFKIKEKIDQIEYGIFNALSDAIFNLRLRDRDVLKGNEKYRNIHNGERCFIFGTGPSINRIHPSHIECLSKERIFAVNSFYKASSLSSLVPDYYGLIDNNYWGVASYTFKEIFEKYCEQPPVFITDVRALPYLRFSGDVRSVPLYTKNYPVNTMRYDLKGNLSITMNVVSSCIQAAIFMGFKEIYLLGCDYNLFCSQTSSHCYDDSDERNELPSYNLAFYLKYYHLTTEFHYLLSQLAKKLGVKIINLTDGSLLDAYERKKLTEILEVAKV